MTAKTTTHVRATRIAQLNDRFRRCPAGGQLLVTAGVIALGKDTLPRILELVAAYDDFEPGNDPYGEHDFGAFTWSGQTLFWKIDCYDRDLAFGSPDAADPFVTTRVLTVMLAEEY